MIRDLRRLAGLTGLTEAEAMARSQRRVANRKAVLPNSVNRFSYPAVCSRDDGVCPTPLKPAMLDLPYSGMFRALELVIDVSHVGLRCRPLLANWAASAAGAAAGEGFNFSDEDFAVTQLS